MFERKLTRKEVELIQEIETFIKDKHRKAQGHDHSHVLQVARYAIQIAEAIPDEVNPFIPSAKLPQLGQDVLSMAGG